MVKIPKNKGKKVFVGMSGGVDSSVSACLLKEAGYDVTCVFIKVWQPDWTPCTWKEERLEAMRASAHIGIPFLTLDLEKEYKKDVADYMIAEYRAGRTPNPDVMCNKYVKFGGFLNFALENGADYIATGHYAQISKKENRKIEKKDAKNKDNKNIFELVAGKDTEKDQSYFIWTLNKKELSHTLFPVGHLLKSEVRKLAKKFGLPNALKKDSQGICFLGKLNMKEFLNHYIENKKGDVLNEKGKKIGYHDGAWKFTLGERHGFNVIDKSDHDAPYYVSKKDIVNNTLTVSNKSDKGLLSEAKTKVEIKDVNWCSGELPNTKDEIGKDKIFFARSRYREKLERVHINLSKNSENPINPVEIEFLNPQNTLSSGQSIVIYSGEKSDAIYTDMICLGGGIII
ncbi:MAG: tRNA 2-thiouridine(34) synthase MnmA [bacterium]|nr:tRNA 2-thiouridine(34) synthase MnmA [bacterium]